MGKAMWDILSSDNEFELIGCEKEDDVNKKIEHAEVVILAVKPQSFSAMAEKIRVDLSNKLVISIMAGVGIERMCATLKTRKIVRTLPNLALKVGQSSTVWKAGDYVSIEEKNLVKKILGRFGQEIEVETEEKIPIIGVVSGCGPGFIAYFGEKMAEFLGSKGVDPVEAEKIARQTLIGTGEVVKKNQWNLTDMRQKVSSKGGLTEAGVKIMEKEELGKIFKDVGEAALKRDKELNQ